MGLTKQYLRYQSSSQFSVIASTRCNVILLNYRNSTDRYAAVANCENVCIWDFKTQQRVMILSGGDAEVTCMATNSDGKYLAIGRTDGSVQITDLFTGNDVVTFNGHKTSVSAVVYDEEGLRLASGSQDGDVVVWDLVDQKGLCRLKGHKGMVTCCYFVKKHSNILITSSKDTNIKWWDLDVQFCFKTLMDHRAEIWQFSLNSNEDRLITGSADSELRVYNIEFIDQNNVVANDTNVEANKDDNDVTMDGDDEGDLQTEDRLVKCKKVGSVFREGKDRVVSLRMTSDGRYLVCHGNRKLVEIFRVLNDEELVKKRKKEAKKLKRKLNQEGGEEAPEAEQVVLEASDMILKCSTVYASFSLTSMDVARVSSGSNNKDEYVIVCVLRNNQLQIIRGDPKLMKETVRKSMISINGHRSESRSACFSSDNRRFITTGAETAKLWNRESQQCIRTFPCNRPTCCLLVPGDLQLILGTSDGNVEIYDIGSGDRLQSTMAHIGGVTSITLLPGENGVATGGLDRSVRFHQFELEDDPSTKLKRLQIAETRLLSLEEQVMDIKFTADGKYIAVALTDNSILIFYTDTLRFKLKLYEHSLPVNSISCSDDSELIVSGSRDRSVIIWGLDFGNKHKKLFAHDNDVTKVEFVPETHLFFSCGKDKMIKQWDADKFILIQVLKGHADAVWYVLPSYDGDLLLSSGNDKSLRLWERTQEIVIPDEEREQEREEQTDINFAQNLKITVPGENADGKAQMASKTTKETVAGAEKIMDAIELHREESEKEEEFNRNNRETQLQYRSKHPILMAYKIDAARWVLQTIQSIKSSDLEEALLVIPFSYVCELLKLLNKFVSDKYQVELACRCILFLLRIHHGQITANVPVDQIADLQVNAKTAIQTLRDRVGFNLAGLQHIRRQVEMKDEISIFADVTDAYKEKKKKKRKGDSLKRNILAM